MGRGVKDAAPPAFWATVVQDGKPNHEEDNHHRRILDGSCHRGPGYRAKRLGH